MPRCEPGIPQAEGVAAEEILPIDPEDRSTIVPLLQALFHVSAPGPLDKEKLHRPVGGPSIIPVLADSPMCQRSQLIVMNVAGLRWPLASRN
jgi:hypothetical protein